MTFAGFAAAETCEGDHLILPDAKALPSVQALADRGDSHAQAQLGLVYLRGQVVGRDANKGVAWLEKSAAAGNSEGQFLLAETYIVYQRSEDGLPRALNLLRKSADNGCLAALFYLGILNTKGMGVPHNTQAGIEMIKKAAEGGYSSAQMWLGELLITGDGISRDAQAGFAWEKRAADSSDSAAKVSLAGLYLAGIGTKKNPEAARSLLNDVLSKKDDQAPNAAYILGRIYMEGRGVPVNKIRALELMSYAAYSHVSDSAERAKKLASEVPKQKLTTACSIYNDPEFVANGTKEFAYANMGEAIIVLRSYARSVEVYFPDRSLLGDISPQCISGMQAS